MAVTRVWRKSGGTCTINEKGVRRYRVPWGIQLNNPLTDELTIRAAVGLPQIYHPHSVDLGALCTTVDLRQQDTGWYYDADIEYRSDAMDPLQFPENPLNRPPEIEWSTEMKTVAATKDRDGNPIITASKETFDPPPEDEQIVLVLSYSRNLLLPSITDRFDWVRTVNETAWYGYEPETATVADLKIRAAHENNVSYLVESWVIKIDRTLNDVAITYGPTTYAAGTLGVGWNLRPLHRGFYQITGGARVLITDTAGRAGQTESLLAADGSALPIGGTPVFLNFPMRDTADFNTLGIP